MGWSDLPGELLSLILLRLSSIDLLAFRATCVSWNLAFKADSCRLNPKPGRPLLVFPSISNSSNHDYFSVSSGTKTPVVTLPDQLNGRCYVCIGSSLGWLIIADEFGNMYLLHPMTGSRVALPSVSSLPCVKATHHDSQGRIVCLICHSDRKQPESYVDVDHMSRDMLHKAVLVDDGRGGKMVLIMYKEQHQWTVARAGDKVWKSVSSRSFPVFRDMIKHKRQLYANTSQGWIYVFSELDNLGSASPDCFPCANKGLFVSSSYLVKSPLGDLMQIQLVNCDFTTWHNKPFVVQMFDDCTESWEVTEDIGQVALLVDFTNAVSASTQDCPELRANCIYFTQKKFDEVQVCLFDLKNNMIELVETFSPQNHTELPPFWFTPRLLLS